MTSKAGPTHHQPEGMLKMGGINIPAESHFASTVFVYKPVIGFSGRYNIANFLEFNFLERCLKRSNFKQYMYKF